MALKCFVYVKNSAALKNNLELNNKLVYRPDHPTETNRVSFESTLEDVHRSMINPTTITYPCSVFGAPRQVVSGTPPNTTNLTLYGSDDIITVVYDKEALQGTLNAITATKNANFKPDNFDLRSTSEGMFHYILKILLYCYNFPSEASGSGTTPYSNFLDRVLYAADYTSAAPRTGSDATHWDTAFDGENFKGKYVKGSAVIPTATIIKGVNLINFIDLKFNFNEDHPSNSNSGTPPVDRVKFELPVKAYYNPDEFIKENQKSNRFVYLYEDKTTDDRITNNSFNPSHQVSIEEFRERIIQSLHKGLNEDKNNYKHFESYKTTRMFPLQSGNIEGTDIFWIFHSYKLKFSTDPNTGSKVEAGELPGDRPSENTIKGWIQHYLKNDSETHGEGKRNKKDNKYYVARWPDLFSNTKIIIWPVWTNIYENARKHIISIKDLRDQVQKVNLGNHAGPQNIGTDYVEVFYVGNESGTNHDFAMPILCFDANSEGRIKTPLHNVFKNYVPINNIVNDTNEKGYRQFQYVLLQALKICAPINTVTNSAEKTGIEKIYKFHIGYGGKDNNFKVRFEFNGKKYYVQSSENATIPARIDKETSASSAG